MNRMQKVDPFNGSQGDSLRHAPGDTDTKKVPVKTNTARTRMSGIEDPLHAALGHRGPPLLPEGEHTWTHSKRVHPTGVHYNPAGAFGRRHATGIGSTHQIYGGNRHSAVPGNAVGSPPGRRGGNAVGSPPNRTGHNAIGNPPHRRGTNAIGSPPNRFGGNALASDFRPRFGKPHGHRV